VLVERKRTRRSPTEKTIFGALEGRAPSAIGRAWHATPTFAAVLFAVVAPWCLAPITPSVASRLALTLAEREDISRGIAFPDFRVDSRDLRPCLIVPPRSEPRENRKRHGAVLLSCPIIAEYKLGIVLFVPIAAFFPMKPQVC